MQRIVFKDTYDCADYVHDDYVLNDHHDILVVAKYDEIKTILCGLIHHGHEIEFAQLYDKEWNNYDYDMEYYLYLSEEGIDVSPAFGFKTDGFKKDTYLETFADKTYIHEDCNSAIIKYIKCDDIKEFAFTGDDECDCGDEDNGGLIHDYKSESVDISRSDDGEVCGFTKSWTESNDNGFTYHSSFSFFSDDIGEIRRMADIYDVVI